MPNTHDNQVAAYALFTGSLRNAFDFLIPYIGGNKRCQRPAREAAVRRLAKLKDHESLKWQQPVPLFGGDGLLLFV